MSDVAPSAPAAAPSTPSESPVAGGNAAAPARNPLKGNSAPSAPGNAAPKGVQADLAPKVTNAPVKPAAPVAAKPEAPKAPTAAEKRKYKLNIDGAVQEREYSDDQIAAELQKSSAAQKRFEEAAKIQKAYQQLREEGKKDPRVLLKELAGIENPREWAEKLLAEEWQREVMTPEQRAAQEQQSEMERFQAEKAQWQAERQAEFEAAQAKQLETQIEADVKAAFELSGFEFNGDNLEAFVKVMSDALEYGVELTPAQVVAQVKAERDERDGKFAKGAKEKLLSLKGDALLSELGDDVVKEIIRASIAKHDQAQADVFSPPSVVRPEKTQENRPKPTSTLRAWRDLGR